MKNRKTLRLTQVINKAMLLDGYYEQKKEPKPKTVKRETK